MAESRVGPLRAGSPAMSAPTLQRQALGSNGALSVLGRSSAHLLSIPLEQNPPRPGWAWLAASDGLVGLLVILLASNLLPWLAPTQASVATNLEFVGISWMALAGAAIAKRVYPQGAPAHRSGSRRRPRHPRVHDRHRRPGDLRAGRHLPDAPARPAAPRRDRRGLRWLRPRTAPRPCVRHRRPGPQRHPAGAGGGRRDRHHRLGRRRSPGAVASRRPRRLRRRRPRRRPAGPRRPLRAFPPSAASA